MRRRRSGARIEHLLKLVCGRRDPHSEPGDRAPNTQGFDVRGGSRKWTPPTGVAGGPSR